MLVPDAWLTSPDAVDRIGRASDKPLPSKPEIRMASIDSLFQIVGAASFCAPPPYGPVGYLATTVLEVLFGGSDGSTFFSELEGVLKEINGNILKVEWALYRERLDDIQVAVQDYTTEVQAKYKGHVGAQGNGRGRSSRYGDDFEPPLDFFWDPLDPGSSLIDILEKNEDKLRHAANSAQKMWEDRSQDDLSGSLCLYSYYLLAITAYLSCHRQKASAYAHVANLMADTNSSDLLAKPEPGAPGLSGSALENDKAAGAMAMQRPEPRVLLLPGANAPGTGVDFLHWTGKHWEEVNIHRALVTDSFMWPKGGSRTLSKARLEPGNIFGYYNRLWFECIELWRRAETSLSLPAEIYRHFRRTYRVGKWLYSSDGFGHGWLSTQQHKDWASVDEYRDLLPEQGGSDQPMTRRWLDDWLEEMAKHHPSVKMANLNASTPEEITPRDQKEFLAVFRGIFGIGFADSRCTLYLLMRVRRQLQAWRLGLAAWPDDPDSMKLHAAAWPSTGELSALVARLDESLPCSWERGANYLSQVLACLEERWNDMAGNNGAGSDLNPAGLSWMKGVTFWWKDRSSADQAPMPLLPETIALVLEVWLAAAMRANQLQAYLRDKDDRYEAYDCYEYLKPLAISLDASTLLKQDDLVPAGASHLACTFPDVGLSIQNHFDEDFDKAVYDQHRDEIRKAWKRKRQQKLDELLKLNYGLEPSKPGLSASESIVQAWADGLIDLSDDQPLQTPDQVITEIQVEPGLLPPGRVGNWWKKGNTVSYSYQLRSLSSFKTSGSDQLSQESKPSRVLTFDDQITSSTLSTSAGVVIKVPRDQLMLARQFSLWRTIRDPGNPDPKTNSFTQWIGSGSFSPGQTEASVFHDGALAKPAALAAAAISPAPAEIGPPTDPNWRSGYHAQYQLAFFDSHGTGAPTPPSDFSEPKPIDPQHGFAVTIAADMAGLASQAQVNRRIVQCMPDGTVKEVGKAKPIAKGGFPVGVDAAARVLTLIDGITVPHPEPVVFSLSMSNKGLDLRRSDQPLGPAVWSSYGKSAVPVTMALQQGDGNLVLYDQTRTPRWASNTMEAPNMTNSRRALRLRANGELAIVAGIDKDELVTNGLLFAGDPALPSDRPAVFLRSGELMLPGQVLSIANQAPVASLDLVACHED